MEKDLFLPLLMRNHVNVRTRTILFNTDINRKTLRWFAKSMAILEEQGSEDIVIELTTDGGDVDSAFGIIDIIEQSPCKVGIIGTATVASAGVFILASGHTRFVSKYCEVMWHHLSANTSGNLATMKADIVRNDKVQKMINEYMAKRTGKPYTYWASLGKHLDHFFTIDELIETGLVHAII
jgi:ATP-dependent Clp protease, protease subunit